MAERYFIVYFPCHLEIQMLLAGSSDRILNAVRSALIHFLYTPEKGRICYTRVRQKRCDNLLNVSGMVHLHIYIGRSVSVTNINPRIDKDAGLQYKAAYSLNTNPSDS